MVFAQNKAGIEFLSGLACQAFEDGCSFCKNQISDIVLREERATHLTEDMEATPVIPALGDLGIDAYALISAFGTVIGRVRFLYAGEREQFLADGAHIGIDALREFFGWHLSRFYGCKSQFPRSRHLRIGNLLILDYLIDRQALVRRTDGLLFPADLITEYQCFDDVGSCGRCADTALSHRLALVCFFNLLACILHGRQQGCFRIERLGFGLMLGDFRGE